MRAQVLEGDVRATLATLPASSVHCVVTSPPYWGLRSYLPRAHPLKALEIGQEATPEAYVATLVDVFREVRRVLHPSGTVWVNIGDSYAATGKSGGGAQGAQWSESGADYVGPRGGKWRPAPEGLKPKDLCLIPERLALALQADGWWIRSRICWAKRSPMPESVSDRPTSAWEHVWMLAKSARYFWDAEAVKQPAQSDHASGNGFTGRQGGADYQARTGGRGTEDQWSDVGGLANLRNFWLLGPEPYAEAHFATFPSEIPKRAILAGTSARGCCPRCLAPWVRIIERDGQSSVERARERGHAPKAQKSEHYAPQNLDYAGHHEDNMRLVRTVGWEPTCDCPTRSDNSDECDFEPPAPVPCTVLDPFAGSGTTLAVAIELGRRALGCELNPAYLRQIEDRTRITPGLQLA